MCVVLSAPTWPALGAHLPNSSVSRSRRMLDGQSAAHLSCKPLVSCWEEMLAHVWPRLKGQYISNRDQRSRLRQLFGPLRSDQHDHEILEALFWSEGLGRGDIALLRFVFVVDLLEFATIDAQAPGGQRVPSQPLEQALHAQLLHGWRFASVIGHRFADLKDRLGKTQAIRVQVGFEGGVRHQGA